MTLLTTDTVREQLYKNPDIDLTISLTICVLSLSLHTSLLLPDETAMILIASAFWTGLLHPDTLLLLSTSFTWKFVHKVYLPPLYSYNSAAVTRSFLHDGLMHVYLILSSLKERQCVCITYRVSDTLPDPIYRLYPTIISCEHNTDSVQKQELVFHPIKHMKLDLKMPYRYSCGPGCLLARIFLWDSRNLHPVRPEETLSQQQSWTWQNSHGTQRQNLPVLTEPAPSTSPQRFQTEPAAWPDPPSLRSQLLLWVPLGSGLDWTCFHAHWSALG